MTLKEPLDLNDLRNPEKDGTVFELADEQAPPGEYLNWQKSRHLLMGI